MASIYIYIYTVNLIYNKLISYTSVLYSILDNYQQSLVISLKISLNFSLIIIFVYNLYISLSIQATIMNSNAMQTEILFGNNVIFSNKNNFIEKINTMKKYGPSKLSIITDFDYTLSKFSIDGNRGSCCHKVMEDCDLLTDDVYAEAQTLQKKYYPLEVDPNLSMDMKIKYMVEWVELSHALLYRVGIKKEDVYIAAKKSIESNKIAIRQGVNDFFKVLNSNNIPALIFSAGIADVLEAILNILVTDINWNNVHVISNRCIFAGPNDVLNSFEEPVLHVFNKKTEAYLHTGFFQRPDVNHRKSLLLLGDSLGDGLMSEGMECDPNAIIKVGFLNDRLERLPDYLNVFDVIVFDDPGFDVAIGIVNNICSCLSLDNLSSVTDTTGSTSVGII